MNPLRLGVIGAGHLGRIHARLLCELPDVELVGVVDPDLEARESVAAEVGARPLADYLDLADKIDAAIVATPTHTHHQIGTELARRGIHLFVEKPLAIGVAEADLLVRACRNNQLVLQVGHVERYNPALQKVLPQIRQPKYIDAVRVSSYPFRSTDIGVVLDLMIHDLDVALSLVRSPVRSVDALGLSVLGNHEDAAQARIIFANGCVANFTASRVSYASVRKMQIWTPDCFALVDFANQHATQIHPHREILADGFSAAALPSNEQVRLKEHLFEDLLVKKTTQASASNPISEEQQDFVECIRSGRMARVSGEEGLNALVIAQQVLERIAHHQWDGTVEGRTGPHITPAPSILPGPKGGEPESAPGQRKAG